MSTTYDIVQKLWNLCNLLRDDGITFSQYVTELTYILFLKMAKETETESQLPSPYRWDALYNESGLEQLSFYKQLLLDLGKSTFKKLIDGEEVEYTVTPLVQSIYNNAQTSLRQPANLNKLVEEINKLDWYSAREEGLGDLYEGLLEKNANETKSGAGQYFTPRPLIDAIVDVSKPQAGEVISDPASGTLGFLICADRYIKEATDDLFDLDEETQHFQKHNAFYGVELVPDTRRLALMNAMLHDIHGQIHLGDSLAPMGESLPKSDLILANPPFGTKSRGEGPKRSDFTFETNNKQLAFLQHIYRNLKPGGRASVVLPDNVLFEDNVGQKIRADLMDKCNLHTILRLPTGIFYAQGVKTNVLFFQKGPKGKERGNTKDVWVYDLRTNMPSFGKRNPLTRAHFDEFVTAFGDDANGRSKRKDTGEEGRFRRFTIEDIERRGDNLNITWLRDENVERAEDLPEPDVIAKEMMDILSSATNDLQELMDLLEVGQ